MTDTIRTGIIGLGIMGRRMLEQMLPRADFEPVAIWDPSVDSMTAAQALAPGIAVTRAEQVIADSDLVYMACPPVPRRDYALMAAEAGKSLFLEKPLGFDLAATTDMVDRIRAIGVPAAVNFVQASSPPLAHVLAGRGDGTMGALAGGDIHLTYSQWPRAWQVDADWLRFRAEGGMTREVMSHLMFCMLRVMGPMEIVWSRPEFPGVDDLCETAVMAELRNRDGLRINIMAQVGGAGPDRQEVTFRGEKTSFRIAEFYHLLATSGDPWATAMAPPADPRGESLQAQLDQMALCHHGTRHSLATLDEALSVARLIEGLLSP